MKNGGKIDLKLLALFSMLFLVMCLVFPKQAYAAPSIDYESHTDANNSFVNRNWTYVNISITEADVDSAAIEWNGTNVTIYGRNLLGLWHLNNNTEDSSQYANNGLASPSVNCSREVAGYFGSACSFNGLTSCINVSMMSAP